MKKKGAGVDVLKFVGNRCALYHLLQSRGVDVVLYVQSDAVAIFIHERKPLCYAAEQVYILAEFLKRFPGERDIVFLGFAVGNDDEQENGAQEAFVLLNGEQTDAKAYCFGDVWYFKKDFIDENLNHRFYLDVANDELIYTTPTKIVTIPFESQAYYVGDKVKKEHYVVARRVDEDIYIAADFIKERADFIYEVRNEPYRMLVTTVYGTSEYVHIADEGCFNVSTRPLRTCFPFLSCSVPVAGLSLIIP